MRLEAPFFGLIEHVALNMRDRDFAEFSALYDTNDRKELAERLARTYSNRRDTLCALHENIPVCVGMFIPTRPNVVTCGFFATDHFPRIALPATRFIKLFLDRLEDHGVHRMEAVSLAGYDEVHRWLRVLGFEQETGPLRNFGRNGETFIQFARIKGDPRPSRLRN